MDSSPPGSSVNGIFQENTFKGLYLIDTVPEERWTEFCDIIQEAAMRTTSTEKKNGKRQNCYLRWPYKLLRKEDKQKAKEKRKDTHCNTEFQGEIRRTSSVINAKK